MCRPTFHTVSENLYLPSIDSEEAVLCEVSYSFYPPYREGNDWCPFPGDVEVAYVGHKGVDVSALLTKLQWEYLEERLLDSHLGY